MKVILLENIKKLGKKYEVIEVADGYAKNFLLPQKKAELATDGNLKALKKKEEKEKKKRKKKKEEIEKLISELEDKEFIIETKVGEKNQLFESINSEKISEKIKKEGYDVSEKQVKLDKPIKQLTEKEVELQFNHDLKTNIKIKIEESK